MVRKNFKVGGFDASNVNIRANGFAATLTANAGLASNVSFSLPGSTGNLGQVLTTDGSGNLYFSDSSANTQVYVGDTLVSNTALILEAGNGVSISTNANSGIVSFSTSMSNVTSQTIAVDGSANTFTLAKSVSNSHMVLVSYNGLLQGPEEYSVSDTTLTISNSKPLLADSKIEVRYFDFFDLPGVASGGGGGGGTQAQGSISGYTSGGASPAGANIIDKFPFSTDSNASDVGDLTQARRFGLAGQSSSISGYTTGGMSTSTSTLFNTIDKFPFASNSNATDVGDLTQVRIEHAGQSSTTHGYTAGGRGFYSTPSSPNPAYRSNVIDKFPFSTDSNSSDVGDLTIVKHAVAGHSSTTHGYVSGGIPPSNSKDNQIEKFPFSTDSNASDVGDLTSGGRRNHAGQSSSTHGYATSGNVSAIDKFSFASDENATNIGTVPNSGGQYGATGQSSTTNGYQSGSDSPSYNFDIYKFSFTSDGNASDVGDLTVGRYRAAGQQV